jgi:hypothetical protein
VPVEVCNSWVELVDITAITLSLPSTRRWFIALGQAMLRANSHGRRVVLVGLTRRLCRVKTLSQARKSVALSNRAKPDGGVDTRSPRLALHVDIHILIEASKVVVHL